MNLPFCSSIQVVVFVVTFILALIAGPILIPALTRLKFGQTVRDDGPASHFKKTGTPTIGGLIFLIPILLVGAYYSRIYPEIKPLVLVTLGFGLIGFIDDFIKVIKKRKDGLYANQKTILQLIVAAVFAVYISRFTDVGSNIVIPYVDITVAPWMFIAFTVILLYATANAVNITDGLDGLAAGVTLIVMVFFTIVAMTRNEWDYIKVFSASIAGGCLGFLAFNSHPARVFMGDTGSLALGGALGAIAIMMRMPLILLVVGGIYVVETLSVIIQVSSYKLRGKRVFKMAPLHHHFELSGWKETKVVTVFYIMTAVLCFIGLLLLRIRFF
ncbi:MAG: phospho-N-acetylmuramoyl-pentapeptide-transferase [Clostridia bacterium]|nr:phospho-N-acetylmuramoyl-pentapeptide-transferase [Clostridia bacterium]